MPTDWLSQFQAFNGDEAFNGAQLVFSMGEQSTLLAASPFLSQHNLEAKVWVNITGKKTTYLESARPIMIRQHCRFSVAGVKNENSKLLLGNSPLLGAGTGC